MARKPMNECTKHHIFLCPDIKMIVKKVMAETPHQISIGDAIVKIIKEWNIKNSK